MANIKIVAGVYGSNEYHWQVGYTVTESASHTTTRVERCTRERVDAIVAYLTDKGHNVVGIRETGNRFTPVEIEYAVTNDVVAHRCHSYQEAASLARTLRNK